MKYLSTILFFTFCILGYSPAYAQKINGEIFIPLNDRSDIKMNPRIDTLDNKEDYEFKVRVSPDFKISQFLFEKGLATQNDSVLVINANSQKDGGTDTATLRVIVTSIRGNRIMLFQKQFIVRVPEKIYPIIKNSKSNIIMVNDKVTLERNNSYAKDLLIENHPFVTLYDNATSMKKIDVKGVTISLMEKEGKQYISKGDTLSADAIHELKKIKKPTPVYIRVDGQSGKTRKTVWNRIVVYNE
jgi:hypothetical protein